MTLDAGDAWEITSLLGRYSHTLDGGDAAGFAALFTPDGTWSGPPGSYGGTKELTDFAAAYHKYPGALNTRHLHSNIVIDGDGDAASVLSDCVVIGPEGDEPILVALTCRYRDSVVKTADGWRFERREVFDLWPDDIDLSLDTDSNPGGE